MLGLTGKSSVTTAKRKVISKRGRFLYLCCIEIMWTWMRGSGKGIKYQKFNDKDESVLGIVYVRT